MFEIVGEDVFSDLVFKKMLSNTESRLADIGASFLFCSIAESQAVEENFDVSFALFFVCPFQNTYKWSSFSYTDSSMKIFIIDAIVSTVLEKTSRKSK